MEITNIIAITNHQYNSKPNNVIYAPPFFGLFALSYYEFKKMKWSRCEIDVKLVWNKNGSALFIENRTTKNKDVILFNCGYGKIELYAIRKIFYAIT